ncbi:unnamed protein product [Rhizoctonia solani]|uniref:F-box domain-containing protein n=1 Tax=Rhizoctonia solani TaxID=456999 RepID=A0A8H2WVD8_9AGAM|nr:unnamed protein product [Rhizoctonia solani]
MPPLTRSRTRATNAPVTKVNPAVSRSATGQSTTKSTSKAPPKKKARGNKGLIGKGSPSVLAFHFASLPLELFLEASTIARHLHPLDLIRLSRSSKLFRNMFMRRPATEIWRAVLANAGLPPCPDSSMSEPRYTALLFLEQCTECHKPATRHVDPIFLVRLCYTCRKDMAITHKEVGKYQSLISRSEFLVPPRGNAARSYWYMMEDCDEVVEKARQLHEAGDNDALRAWMHDRVEFVRVWREKVAPLVEWVESREEEYKAGLRMLRETRLAEIDDRLIELGWELVDIEKAEYYSESWKSLVNKTKPLEEKEWDDMLPRLLHGLNRARRSRLKAEAKERHSARSRTISDWLYSLRDDQVHITLCWKDSNSGLVGPTQAPTHSESIERRNLTVQVSRRPSSGDFPLRAGQPYLEALLNQDKSMKEFQLEFQDKRTTLKEQIYMSWRPSLEAALVKMLPEDLVPVDIESSDFYLQAHTGEKDSTTLDYRLSSDMRKLLRADVRFIYQGAAYRRRSTYYPVGFDGWTVASGWSTPTYDPASSAVAKALLGALQRANASYLEMQALGQLFLCGRCTREPSYLTWDGIVGHYVDENNGWGNACTRNARHSQKGQGIALVFTHDMKKVDGEKPLIAIVAKQDQTPGVESPKSYCKLCSRIGHGYGTETSHIARHVQEVHLIESPKLGEHYAEWC